MCLIYTWEPFSRRTVYQALKTVWYCRSKTLPLWHASIMTLRVTPAQNVETAKNVTTIDTFAQGPSIFSLEIKRLTGHHHLDHPVVQLVICYHSCCSVVTRQNSLRESKTKKLRARRKSCKIVGLKSNSCCFHNHDVLL